MVLAGFGKTLVLAPHPDDEVLGTGGTIARLADAGVDVVVAIVTTGQPPTFSAEATAALRAEAARAHAHLCIRETRYLDQPAAQLSEVPHSVLNAAVRALVVDVAPQTLLVPFVGDIHRDHQLTFLSALIAARPHQTEYPPNILAYETMSETNWNAPYVSPGFAPTLYVDITATLERKLAAMRMFGSQLREFPHERSLDALRALAMVRGATVHRPAAEAFVVVRQVT